MTQPSQFVDPGNELLAPAPAYLDTGMVSTPSGNLAVLTVRTASTTLTVFLGPDDLRSWIGVLTGLSGQFGGKLVAASARDVAAVSQLHSP